MVNVPARRIFTTLHCTNAWCATARWAFAEPASASSSRRLLPIVKRMRVGNASTRFTHGNQAFVPDGPTGLAQSRSLRGFAGQMPLMRASGITMLWFKAKANTLLMRALTLTICRLLSAIPFVLGDA